MVNRDEFSVRGVFNTNSTVIKIFGVLMVIFHGQVAETAGTPKAGAISLFILERLNREKLILSTHPSLH